MNLLLFRVMQAFALIEISLRQNRSRIATHRAATQQRQQHQASAYRHYATIDNDILQGPK